jgi:hypothetical protein
MTQLTWDQTGQRTYETGVDHGVLFQVDTETGEYVNGVAWNGLTTVTESPSGAEASPQYADNIKYLNLLSTEMFGCTIEAFTYPPEFEQNDGSATPTSGVSVGQQPRKTFGFCYRTLKGNDTEGNSHGYKLHLVWGALAAPSEKAYATVNDSPEAITFSWEVTTTPVAVGTVLSVDYAPTASMTIDSTKVDPAKLATLEEYLYGTASEDPVMPLPADVILIMASALTLATPTAPTYNATTDVITIPSVTGVEYLINGVVVPSGETDPITENTLVRARPVTGYRFPDPVQDEWLITFA